MDKIIGPHKLKLAIRKKNCNIAALVIAPESPAAPVVRHLTYVAAAA